MLFPTPSRKVLIVHDDCSNLLYAAPGNMTRSDLEAMLDVLAFSKPDVLTIDAALPDLCYYNTRVGNYWGQHWDKPFDNVLFWNIARNLRALIEAGDDPLEVMATRMHQHGLRMLAGVRMNDPHHGWLPFLQSEFDAAHPEWHIPGRAGMDYVQPGVREHRFAIIREIVETYDVDGIGLDFIRRRPFLSSLAEVQADIMTEYVARVRRLLDRVGREREKELILGAFVPWDLEVLKQEGLDAGTWISDGLLDYIYPSEEHYVNWNLPVQQWVPLVEGTNTVLCPSLFGDVADGSLRAEMDSNAYGQRVFLTLAQARSCASTFYAAGADGISFYNFYTHRHADKFPHLGELRYPSVMRTKERHYLFARTNEFRGSGWPGLEIKFGPEEDTGVRKTYSFTLREDLSRANAVLTFKGKNLTPVHELLVDVNGVRIAATDWRTFHPLPSSAYRCPDGYPTNWSFRFLELSTPIGMPPLKIGDNEIGFQIVKKNPGLPLEVAIRDIEFFVRPR